MLSEKIPLASAAQLMMLMLFAVRSKKRSRRAFLDAPAWLQSEDSWIPVRWETCPSTEKNVHKNKHRDGTKTINGFRVYKDRLGDGNFAKVKRCEEEETGRTFAMKVFRKLPLRRQREFMRSGEGMTVRTHLDKVYGELELMKGITHPGCVRLYAIFDEAHQNGKIYAVLEHVPGGQVMDWDEVKCRFFAVGMAAQEADASGLIPEEKMKVYLSDLLEALSYLHAVAMVAHRDVKPQNLLLDGSSTLKLGDFGVAAKMDEDHLVHGTEGTYPFFSPEMCQTGYVGHDGRKADMWATGVCVWAFLLGTLPFHHEDLAALMDAIAFGEVELPEGNTLSEDSRRLLKWLLCKDPAARPLSEAVLLDAMLGGAQSPHGPLPALRKSERFKPFGWSRRKAETPEEVELLRLGLAQIGK
ncbi:unnamed protein product [Durusdinium trenchii]|uniref:Protein kinase domain-containing protein n=1 Tax=Durusdinium trenchii TaxID=1381693 RepID=A0ABP0Q2P0_9DINO